jgi:hypothetical protein
MIDQSFRRIRELLKFTVSAGASSPRPLVDSKLVNREIKRVIWPTLKMAGFKAFSSRTAWRYGAETIDVFDFQSFNRYNADVLGITTFSFQVNLGCHLSYLPPSWPLKERDGQPRPQECSCEFRGRLFPLIELAASDHSHIWAIDSKGENIETCISDVNQKIGNALDWFQQFTDADRVLAILLTFKENPGLWGFGNIPSPSRARLAGFAALRVRNTDLARHQLAAAVESGCFSRQFRTVDEAIKLVQ